MPNKKRIIIIIIIILLIIAGVVGVFYHDKLYNDKTKPIEELKDEKKQTEINIDEHRYYKVFVEGRYTYFLYRDDKEYLEITTLPEEAYDIYGLTNNKVYYSVFNEEEQYMTIKSIDIKTLEVTKWFDIGELLQIEDEPDTTEIISYGRVKGDKFYYVVQDNKTDIETLYSLDITAKDQKEATKLDEGFSITMFSDDNNIYYEGIYDNEAEVRSICRINFAENKKEVVINLQKNMVIDHYVDNYFIIDNTGEESEKQKIRIYDMQTKELDETIDNVQDYDYLDNMIFYSTNNKLMAFNILTKETTEYYDLSKIPFKDYYIFAYSIDTVLIVEEKAELYEDADEIDDEEIDDTEIDDDESEDEEEPDEKDNKIIIYKKTEVPEIPKVILYMKDGTTKEIPLEELNDFE